MKKYIFVLLIFLTACQSSKSNQDNFIWQIYIKNVQVSASLVDSTTVTHYDGTSELITINHEPKNGKTFVLVELNIKKSKAGGNTFIWDHLFLEDASGNKYSRLDDAFLTQHKFDRLQGIDLRLGEYTGWIAFEVDSQNANKKMILIYFADEGENKVIIAP